jgi:alkyl hydroperoxide reductase subunit AhpC
MNKTIINTNVPEFSVPAFVNGEFKTITKEDTLGHNLVDMFNAEN